MKIRIFPVVGDAYVIELPECVENAYDIDTAVNEWLDENIRMVDAWGYV